MGYEPKNRQEQIRGWIWYYAASLAAPWWVRSFPADAASYRAQLDYWMSQTLPGTNMDSLA